MWIRKEWIFVLENKAFFLMQCVCEAPALPPNRVPEGGHSAYTLYAIYTHCPSPRAFILLSFDVPRTSGDTHKCHQKNIKAPPLSPISLPSSTERIMSPCASSARRHGLSPIAYYAVRMPRSRCAPSSTNHPAATQLFPGD